jgi:hypothetical protein
MTTETKRRTKRRDNGEGWTSADVHKAKRLLGKLAKLPKSTTLTKEDKVALQHLLRKSSTTNRPSAKKGA